jgi:hypothetical protein
LYSYPHHDPSAISQGSAISVIAMGQRDIMADKLLARAKADDYKGRT